MSSDGKEEIKTTKSTGEKRSFEVIESSIGKIGGRYLSKTPAGAAKKAGSKLSNGTEGEASIKLTIKETTRGSKKKQFTYQFTRIYQPDTVEINGKQVTYKYKTKVTAL